jgi:hypothetical protein
LCFSTEAAEAAETFMGADGHCMGAAKKKVARRSGDTKKK